MDAKEFVRNWRVEKDPLLNSYLSEESDFAVVSNIGQMGLTPEQSVLMRSVLDGVLTDTFYTLLLGLDGSARIGDVQHTYKILDEDGSLISECGDFEGEAYEQFQED